ncbi:MAG: phosphomannomutase/phosphoglucomutase [Deltaproteobacteria bacterium]|nr:phosphomannomutase/phosphoglucomutase [Deltaproteobacteria bacterium]
MNPHIFREYDIRGVADTDLTDEHVRAIGRTLGTIYAERGQRKIIVGRDCRVSSRRIRNALVEGLREMGRHVVKIEVGPTPLLYFAVHHMDADGGVMVTGSHNPPEDNGLKILSGKSSFFGDDIRALGLRSVTASSLARIPGGTLEDATVSDAYVAFMTGNVRFRRTDLKVVVDAGNGAGGPLVLACMRALGLDPVALYCEMDGRFPNHHPDPTQPENVRELIETVRRLEADVGIALDGDADRIGAIDANGEIVWGDKLLIAFARDILARRPGSAVLGEVKCSQTLYDDIAEHGGRPIMWKTGHSLIKTKMKEEKALLAGEMSGHMFFADRYYGYDDGVYAALRLVELIGEMGHGLEALLDDVPETFATQELREPCPDAVKFEVVAQVLAHFQSTHDVVDVDGARVNFGDGWGLVRASNTQPVLVLRFEAGSPARRDAIRQEVEAVVRSAVAKVTGA